MLKNKLLLLMANFLHGAMDVETFSFTFPTTLAEIYDGLEKEDPGFAEEMEDMPELCASFDPHKTGDPDTVEEDEFRAQVTSIYLEAMRRPIQRVS